MSCHSCYTFRIEQLKKDFITDTDTDEKLSENVLHHKIFQTLCMLCYIEHKEITLSQWTEFGPAADRTFLSVLANHSLQQEDRQATQYSKETVRQQESTYTQETRFQ